jgi:3-phenylpropionate/trans-cinnamate dioxygenase ferredoxin reductase subunit
VRAAGLKGRVVLIGEEAYPTYERPPLSKKLLTGEVEVETTYLNRSEFYTENDIEFICSARAESLDVGGLPLSPYAGAPGSIRCWRPPGGPGA